MIQHRIRVRGLMTAAAGMSWNKRCAQTIFDVPTEVVFALGLATAFTLIRWPMTVLRVVVTREVFPQGEGPATLGTLKRRS
jgi:hypothetical protein